MIVVTWLIFITSSLYRQYLYDVFQLFEDMLNNSDLYNTNCFHNISCFVNYNALDSEPGNTEEFQNS